MKSTANTLLHAFIDMLSETESTVCMSFCEIILDLTSSSSRWFRECSYMILSLLLLKRFRYLYNKIISLDPQRYYKNDLILGRLFREFCLVFQSSFLIKHIPEAVTRYILLKRCSYKFHKVYRKHLRQSFF